MESLSVGGAVFSDLRATRMEKCGTRFAVTIDQKLQRIQFENLKH